MSLGPFVYYNIAQNAMFWLPSLSQTTLCNSTEDLPPLSDFLPPLYEITHEIRCVAQNELHVRETNTESFLFRNIKKLVIGDLTEILTSYSQIRSAGGVIGFLS